MTNYINSTYAGVEVASRTSNYRMPRKGAEPVKAHHAHIFVSDFTTIETIAMREHVSIAAVTRKVVRLGLAALDVELNLSESKESENV